MNKILAQIKQYTADTILTPVYAMLEVVMEVLLPYITARIIDEGITKNDLGAVGKYGGIMVVAAIISLLAGMMSGVHGAKASTGFACNLREEIYRKPSSGSVRRAWPPRRRRPAGSLPRAWRTPPSSTVWASWSRSMPRPTSLPRTRSSWTTSKAWPVKHSPIENKFFFSIIL